jgi:hypothetical protein
MVANGSVGWNRRRVYQRNALAFTEERKKNQRHKGEALQDDGNCYGALFDPAGTPFALRIAFDEAVAE